MRRAAAVFVALGLLAACGGDDDDDDSAASASGSGSAAEAGDFCDVWPELNSDESALDEEPSESDIEEARELIASARASAPDEIEDEVTQFTDTLDEVLDGVAGGEELDEDAFGELFELASSVGPPIEEWMVDNCSGYEPPTGFEDADSDDDAVDDGEPGSEETALGLAGIDVEDVVVAAFASYQGYSWDGTTFGIYVGDPSEALAGCEAVSAELAAHETASGSATFEVWDGDGEVLVRNDSLAAGDAGSCVEV